MGNIAQKLKEVLLTDVKAYTLSAVLSVLNLVMFHIPFYTYISANISPDFNGVLIFASLIVIMLVANFFAFYLFLYLFRIVGKILLSIIFIGNAITLYFINTYDVIIDDSMMGNVFNTNYAEATSYASWAELAYIVFMGIIPAIYIMCTKINYGSIKRFFSTIGASLGVILIFVVCNVTNFTWIDKHAPIIGSLLMPWSYTVNAVRFKIQDARNNRQEIILPDAKITNSNKDVVVLLIGESARRDHFSLYGYKKETNPMLSKIERLKWFESNSSATYTTAGVKAILEHTDTDELYEILPNYLYRTGADVLWRTTNWGEPPLHIANYVDLKYCGNDSCKYDMILLNGVRKFIENSTKNKVLVILHSSTSHGPSYNQKYPEEFEKFTPVCTSVELSKCTNNELLNAYDNTILYTDYIISNTIDTLKSIDGWNSTMIYVSDHGESLGEKKLYMHGVPIGIAPKEQIEIPFIVWTSDSTTTTKQGVIPTQHHVFHSTLHQLGIESPIYDENMNIFTKQ